jgi:hypothetical protein
MFELLIAGFSGGAVCLVGKSLYDQWRLKSVQRSWETIIREVDNILTPQNDSLAVEMAAQKARETELASQAKKKFSALP